MTDIVIILLLLVLIFKDFITIKVSPKEEKHKEVKDDSDYEKERLEKEFNGIMNYSIDDAIQSKRGDN